MAWLWVALAIVLTILEIAIGTFYFLAFAASALITAISVWLGVESFWFQLLIMAICSMASMFLVPALLQRLNRTTKGFTDYNVRIVGMSATVIRDISPQHNGIIKLATGAEWTAQSQETLQAGASVTVTGLIGNIAEVAASPSDHESAQ